MRGRGSAAGAGSRARAPQVSSGGWPGRKGSRRGHACRSCAEDRGPGRNEHGPWGVERGGAGRSAQDDHVVGAWNLRKKRRDGETMKRARIHKKDSKTL